MIVADEIPERDNIEKLREGDLDLESPERDENDEIPPEGQEDFGENEEMSEWE